MQIKEIVVDIPVLDVLWHKVVSDSSSTSTHTVVSTDISGCSVSSSEDAMFSENI